MNINEIPIYYYPLLTIENNVMVIYGKDQNLPGMINYFAEKMIKNEKIKIFNRGKLKRNQVCNEKYS